MKWTQSAAAGLLLLACSIQAAEKVDVNDQHRHQADAFLQDGAMVEADSDDPLFQEQEDLEQKAVENHVGSDDSDDSFGLGEFTEEQLARLGEMARFEKGQRAGSSSSGIDGLGSGSEEMSDSSETDGPLSSTFYTGYDSAGNSEPERTESLRLPTDPTMDGLEKSSEEHPSTVNQLVVKQVATPAGKRRMITLQPGAELLPLEQLMAQIQQVSVTDQEGAK